MSLSTTFVENCPTLNVRDALICQISDNYKDMHGIRPRWINFGELSDQELIELDEEVRREHDEFDWEYENMLLDLWEEELLAEMDDTSEWDEIDELYQKMGW